MSILDYYETRARFLPTLIIGMPVIFTLNFVLKSQIVNIISLIGSNIILLLVIVYPFSFLIRYCGRKIEYKLWSSWDGPPSTRFLRWSDSFFGDQYKKQLHETIRKNLLIDLSTDQEEKADPEIADNKINQAFMQARSIIRLQDPQGLSYRHNAEYGFNRNLLGSRTIWLLLSMAGVSLCTILWFCKGYEANFYLLLNIVWLLFAIIYGWIFLPSSVRQSADRYAESAWSTFLELSRDKQ